jgi:hypothetical protein
MAGQSISRRRFVAVGLVMEIHVISKISLVEGNNHLLLSGDRFRSPVSSENRPSQKHAHLFDEASRSARVSLTLPPSLSGPAYRRGRRGGPRLLVEAQRASPSDGQKEGRGAAGLCVPKLHVPSSNCGSSKSGGVVEAERLCLTEESHGGLGGAQNLESTWSALRMFSS